MPVIRWLLLLILIVPGPSVAETRAVVVFAAVSLRPALDPLTALLPARTTIAYGATSALARQIDQGAPADIFIAADTDWMDWAANRQLIDPASRRDLARNRLVLAARADTPVRLTLAPGVRLPGRIATGEPRAVPLGRYAQAALASLGLTASLIGAESAAAATVLLLRGEVDLAILYETDVLSQRQLVIVDRFAGTSHPPIRYPMARVVASTHPDAGRVLAALGGAEVLAALRAAGFGAP
jgi:molybdate transport system substrate-binding protein